MRCRRRSRTGSGCGRRTRRGYADTRAIVKENGLVTVCEEAGCPNIGECWDKKHATFMIMGDTCTRACAFCNVKTGMPGALDASEPEHVAEATFKLGLAHIVVTSVDRDDLADGGAEHFAKTIRAIRARCPTTTIEILTPDFLRKEGALEVVAKAKPDVFNHNLETVPSRYLTVRPGARYFHSIRLLQRVKEIDPTIFTKSGIMVGLGEERHEVLQVMDDLRSADVDFLTIGQYLQPTRKHHAVMRYVTPDEFRGYEKVAYTKGFLMVSASPLTRSSHHAGDDFAKLRAARAARAALSCRDAEILQQAPGSPQRGADVRPRRRCRALSRIRAAVPFAEDPAAHARADGTEVVIADMTVSFKLVREAFTSRVTLDRPNLKIMVEYLKGPFSNLENRWTFEPRSETACDVGFFLSYEFKSRMLAMLMGTMFDTAFQRFAAAFEKRADAVYGKGRAEPRR